MPDKSERGEIKAWWKYGSRALPVLKAFSRTSIGQLNPQFTSRWVERVLSRRIAFHKFCPNKFMFCFQPRPTQTENRPHIMLDISTFNPPSKCCPFRLSTSLGPWTMEAFGRQDTSRLMTRKSPEPKGNVAHEYSDRRTYNKKSLSAPCRTMF